MLADVGAQAAAGSSQRFHPVDVRESRRSLIVSVCATVPEADSDPVSATFVRVDSRRPTEIFVRLHHVERNGRVSVSTHAGHGRRPRRIAGLVGPQTR